MKIGLIDVDGHNFPNLALMRISQYHKSKGDFVEWYNTFNFYDVVYISKVFTFTQDYPYFINNAKKIIKGGTGYDITKKLPIEMDEKISDYKIYPNYSRAYGFTTRGCIRNCKECFVPEKEGKIKPYMDIEEIVQDRKEVVLMDNNILSSNHGIKQIEKALKLNLKLDFNQGLDARLIDNYILKLIDKLKYIKSVRLACDSDNMLDVVINVINRSSLKNGSFSVYILLGSDDTYKKEENMKKEFISAYNRGMKIREIGANINPQPYRDKYNNRIVPQWEKDFAKWGNTHQLKNVDFKEYQVRTDFNCSKYFKHFNI